MVKNTVIVTNDTGLHSRPADLFVRTAKLFKSKIHVSKDDKTVDAKNIVKIILLNAKSGSQINIEAEGVDEQEAINVLTSLVESKFEDIDKRVEI